MSPKRGDRVAPPPQPDGWDVVFADNDSAKGWEELSRQAPGNTFKAWQVMRTNPVPRLQEQRHHALRGGRSHVVRAGRLLPQWQIEVTGSGRVWYLVDAENLTVWISWAGTGHPKATE